MEARSKEFRGKKTDATQIAVDGVGSHKEDSDVQNSMLTVPDKTLMLMEDKETVACMREFMIMQQLYRAAIKEVRTKFEILDEEFQIKHAHNPIHHIESRLKSPDSIGEKLKRHCYEPSVQSIRENITDVAGVRVICNYLDDVYYLADLIEAQDDIRLLMKKDYIATPKPNGYRSLHLILQVPVFWAEKTEDVSVEVQIRTIAMDYWASLEHRLKYKSDHYTTTHLRERLKKNATLLAVIDSDMQDIYRSITAR